MVTTPTATGKAYSRCFTIPYEQFQCQGIGKSSELSSEAGYWHLAGILMRGILVYQSGILGTPVKIECSLVSLILGGVSYWYVAKRINMVRLDTRHPDAS